jgi:hypothetical protein
MQRVVNFYEKLPRGAAPEVKPTGILGRYQAKHFGKNPSAKRMWPLSDPGESGEAEANLAPAIIHAIVVLVAIGYAQNYYFHLRKFVPRNFLTGRGLLTSRPGHHKNNAH